LCGIVSCSSSVETWEGCSQVSYRNYTQKITLGKLDSQLMEEMIANATTSGDDHDNDDNSLSDKNYHHDDNIETESIATPKISNVSEDLLVGIRFEFF